MRGAERFFPSLGRAQSVRQLVQRLIGVVHLHKAARLAADRFLKRLVQLGPDDENHPIKARAIRVVNRIIQNDLSVRADRIDLLEPAVARAHSRRHNHQNRLCHIDFSFLRRERRAF